MQAERDLEPLWALGHLPFHVGARERPSNEPLPDTLPFELGADRATGLLVQMPDAGVEAALRRAYRLGSQIGTPLAESGLGRRCRDDFLGFVLGALDRERFDGLSVLELGSGGGALLEALHALGADVTGVDPGAADPAGLPYRVLLEPFRVDRFDRRFDLIVHYGFLEHVGDPVASARDQLELLAPGGRLVFSVPDCRGTLESGDVSMLVHEHWSYFGEDSLAAVAAAAGAQVETSAPAGVAGGRYSVWSRAAAGAEAAPAATADGFAGRAQANLDRLRGFLEDRSGGAPLGIYCPGRFLNYEGLLGGALPPLRYFDDDPALNGLYYPPSAVAIESREALSADPVETVLVVSWTFGAEIAAALRSEPALGDTEVLTIGDLLG